MLFSIQNDPLLLSAVGNVDRMLRSKIFVICKCSGDGTLLTVKCWAPGTHRVSNARGLPGGMLADGIDSYIRIESNQIKILKRNRMNCNPIERNKITVEPR